MPDSTEQVARVLTVAGSDSGAGAGLQADLKTFAAMGVYGTSAVTVVTAQNTVEVSQQFALPSDIVAAQIDAVLSDIGASAVKTGMLANAEIVSVVASKMQEYDVKQLIVDPVMVASSGTELLDARGRLTLQQALLPLAAVVTPNRAEAGILASRGVDSWDDAHAAARIIVELGARSVVITGGDFDDRESSTDLYFDGHGFREFTSVRVQTMQTHGTGCTFSAALAAGLAKGLNVVGAVALAKSYVTLALQHAYPTGRGRGGAHHFYRYWQPPGRRRSSTGGARQPQPAATTARKRPAIS